MNNQGMLPARVMREIISYARESSVERLVLFGSRARGTNSERSDVDLAVYGGDFDRFYWDVQEKTWSLLRFDLIDMSGHVSGELINEIERDGKVIYEKNR